MTKFVRHTVRNLKDDIEAKKPNDRCKYVSEKISFWDFFLLVLAFLVTVVFTILPLVFDYCLPFVEAKYKIITYIVIALIFCGTAIFSFVRNSYFKLIREDYEKEEKEQEIAKYKNKDYEEELVSKMETFASVVQDVVDAQRDQTMSVKRFSRIITNHIFEECQKKYGKDITVALYDMNKQGGITLQSFSSKLQHMDVPELYQKGTIQNNDASISKRFFTFCLLDEDDVIFDLPNKNAILDAFEFKKHPVGRGKKGRNRKKDYTYNQYISFKLKTSNDHTLLIEIISHNSTALGKEDKLRDIAADLSWRYGLLIQSYWNYDLEKEGVK